ncbi:SET domain-containing protein [Mycena kentingensis (nom. inval.)]|nr:SET domain-containing protein [Mycena kentingensis (nom. inval.)]
MLHLKQHYGFDCNCKFCTLDDERTQQRDEWALEWIAKGNDFETRWPDGGMSAPEAIALVRDMWMLALKLDYTSERARWAEEAADVALMHGNAETARRWLGLALKYFDIELGADCQDSIRIREVLRDPTNAENFATRERMELDGPEDAWFDS